MIAIFAMEVGVDPDIPTYCGGLGILVGDILKTAADMGLPFVGVSLMYHEGYLKQKLTDDGEQIELPEDWQPATKLQRLDKRIQLKICGEPVVVEIWCYYVRGMTGHVVPIYFLDTNLSKNSEHIREATRRLYLGDKKCRLIQETLLGIGGVKVLRSLGYNIDVYHINESHAALLILELIRELRDTKLVRKKCVFTTHTPLPTGHEEYGVALLKEVLAEEYHPILQTLVPDGVLNMSRLAFTYSAYTNAVSKRHAEVTREMFPEFKIDHITNGVHSLSWTCDEFKSLFDRYVTGWREDPRRLVDADRIDNDKLWTAHMEAKKRLIDFVHKSCGVKLNPNVLTIGFARRATGYKRAYVVLEDINRLRAIGKGKLQLVFAGKAYPTDYDGKSMIRKIYKGIHELKDDIQIVYIENYDMEVAQLMVAGVDVWLNTPRPRLEASGTSGMKAAHNGVPSLSVLDGWWVEGCIEGVTGWSIEDGDDRRCANSLYDKLENVVIPTFYGNRAKWLQVMKNTIIRNASQFNTHRLITEYMMVFDRLRGQTST